jgi:hypothetical protein
MKTTALRVASGSWRWLQSAGLERFELARTDVGWLLRGTILATGDGLATEARYEVACDHDWRTQHVDVRLEAASGQRRLSLSARDGRWHDGERERETLRGCIDVDLGWSPSTNTLPIRRLGLAVGESSGLVTVAWVRFPALEVEPLDQEYARLSDRLYRYTSRAGAFTAELRVDEEGLVIDYEGAWQRAAAR